MKTIWKESPGYGLMKIHDDTAARRLDFDLPEKCGHTCANYQRLDDSEGEGGATMVSIQIS